MKTIFGFCCFILLSFGQLNAQSLDGSWGGFLHVQGMKMRLVFHFLDTNVGYSAKMDSPDQGAFGIPVDDVYYLSSQLTLRIDAANILFKGTAIFRGSTEGYGDIDSIVGTFKQYGIELPLTLRKLPDDFELENTRPQEPDLSEPERLPYTQEEVTINNIAANVQLSGTLTIPKYGSNFPAVILISGSGPQDRNEELMGHKPFMVIADYFSRRGIAVLRYDDRGFGASTGEYNTATTADFATDASAAVDFLKTKNSINPKKIGLAGHSEGGVIAPMVALNNKDVAFIILMAGTGVKGDSILKMQIRSLSKEQGTSDNEMKVIESINNKLFELLPTTQDSTILIEALKKHLKEFSKAHPNIKINKEKSEPYISLIVEQMSNPWMRYFVTYDPVPALTKVTCPVLAINGDKDIQVPSGINLNAIGNALQKGGNKNYTLKEFPNMNHLFQTCKTGSISEYFQIKETFSPEVMKFMLEWIMR